ncbi:MAG: hypothetical protein C0631_07045 [Sedimenticola sp.]|nr:MAG: hypothetical protein C0631_07045 [Sedimenticola sp.]
MPDYNRHNEVPVFEHRNGKVEANYYNHVRSVLKRINDNIRLQLPRLRTLDLILQADAWIVVDRALNDFPIIAWTDFKIEQRTNLHEPIPCSIKLYHANAGILLHRIFEAMEMMLGEHFDDEIPLEQCTLLHFKVPNSE